MANENRAIRLSAKTEGSALVMEIFSRPAEALPENRGSTIDFEIG